MNVIKIAKSLSREEAKMCLDGFYKESSIVRCKTGILKCSTCKFCKSASKCIGYKISKYAKVKMITEQETYDKFRKILEDNYNRKIVVKFIRFDDEPLKLGYKNIHIDENLRGKFVYSDGNFYSLKSVEVPYMTGNSLFLRGINKLCDNDTLHMIFETEAELENYVINMNKLIKRVNKAKYKQEVKDDKK